MRIHLLPQPYELYISRPKLTQIDGVPLITLERASFSPVALLVKRIASRSHRLNRISDSGGDRIGRLQRNTMGYAASIVSQRSSLRQIRPAFYDV